MKTQPSEKCRSQVVAFTFFHANLEAIKADRPVPGLDPVDARVRLNLGYDDR